MEPWPETSEALVVEQFRLGAACPKPWAPQEGAWLLGGVFVCAARGKAGEGERGDPGWAAAALVREGRVEAGVAVRGLARAPYQAGLLALREGPLLEAAVLELPRLPDVLIVNATGRDHPRCAGLALHLGARLDLPSVGVTHRPLFASGTLPGPEVGDMAPLVLDGREVGCWLRVRRGVRPLAVTAGWRMDLATALAVVRRAAGAARTPLPLREARRLARDLRAVDGGHKAALGAQLPLSDEVRDGDD